MFPSSDCSSSLYCVNGGTCMENGDQYSCTCADGYEGNNCQYIGKIRVYYNNILLVQYTLYAITTR